jgi:hypothetical protein
MKILIIHFGNQCETFIATSVIKGLWKNYWKPNDEPIIYWVCSDKESYEILKYNPNLKGLYIKGEVPEELIKTKFDKLINLSPYFLPADDLKIDAKEIYGFNFSEEAKKYYEILYGNRKTNMNIFQLYFNLCNLKWRGEGYDINYMPRNRSKKNRTGIIVANANLRNFVIDKLKLDKTKLWIIPYKKAIFKKIDEINRARYIITDDFLSLNIALFLRKNVYFLETVPYNTKIELFNQGTSFKVPLEIIK